MDALEGSARGKRLPRLEAVLRDNATTLIGQTRDKASAHSQRRMQPRSDADSFYRGAQTRGARRSAAYAGGELAGSRTEIIPYHASDVEQAPQKIL